MYHSWCRKNPYAEYAYDGVTLSPMEVIFIKVKGFTVDARWTAQHTAVTYDSWLGKKVCVNCHSVTYETQLCMGR